MKPSPKKVEQTEAGQTGRKDFTRRQGNARSKAAPGDQTERPPPRRRVASATSPPAAYTCNAYVHTSTKIPVTPSAGNYCACIEFHLDEHHRRGFHTSQLIDYTLEPNPDAGDDKNAPPQKLALAFSTADVVRARLAARLPGRQAPAKTTSPPSASSPNATPNVDRHMPFVASITITPLKQ